MNKVIQLNNINADTISDGLLTEIENFMLDCFHKERSRRSDNTPIFAIKEYSISEVSKKYNLSLEKTKEIVREIQLRNFDKDLGLR